MPDTSSELWNLLIESRLVPRDEAGQLKGAFLAALNSAHDVPAEHLARWLCRQQIVTRYQARILLNGRSGPFYFGGYQIRDRIGDGRLAGMFRAIHEPTQHPVLLQFLRGPDSRDPVRWEEIRNQVGPMRQIDDPQLQRVFLLEIVKPYRFLVTEDIVGSTVRDELQAAGNVPVAEACLIARLVALALGHLHTHGVAYGSVCPDNIWLDLSGNVKLIRDYRVVTQASDRAGSSQADWQRHLADYLAPERSPDGTPATPLADIYGLGCTLYHLLSGQPPYPAGDRAQKVHRHATDTAASLQQSGVPSALAEVVTHMMTKNPALRIAHAHTVAEQLAPFIAAEDLEHTSLPPAPTLVAFQRVVASAELTALSPPSVVGPAYPDQPPVDDLCPPRTRGAAMTESASASASGLVTGDMSEPSATVVAPQDLDPPVTAADAAPRRSATQRVRNVYATLPRRRRILIIGTLVALVAVALIATFWRGRAILRTDRLVPAAANSNKDLGAGYVDGSDPRPKKPGLGPVPSVAEPKPQVPVTLADLLDTKISLSFEQESLEFAIRDLQQEITGSYTQLPFPFKIRIEGNDLQQSGITRNQQIRDFKAEDKAVAQVLTAIVMRANPVAHVASPSDADQKLVWVVRPDRDDPSRSSILITTRAAAKTHHYELPAVFRAE